MAKLESNNVRDLFIYSTLYLKQQTNILRCFSSLKCENTLFCNMLFRCIICSERKNYTADKDEKNILFKTSLLKSHFSLYILLLDFATTAINYVSLSLQSLSKDFFTILDTACSLFLLKYEPPPHQIKYIL